MLVQGATIERRAAARVVATAGAQSLQVRPTARGAVGQAGATPTALTPGSRRLGSVTTDGLPTASKAVVHSEVRRTVASDPHLCDVSIVHGRVRAGLEVQVAPRASSAVSVVDGDPGATPMPSEGREVRESARRRVDPRPPMLPVAAEAASGAASFPTGSGGPRTARGATSPTVAAKAGASPTRTAAHGVASEVATRKTPP